MVENDFNKAKSDGLKRGEIKVENANFSWDGKKDVLSNINIDVKPGSLICVVGAVGSGKTTMVHGLLSLLNRTKGSVRVGGSTALVSQKAFINNASVRENILFLADDVDEDRYQESLRACCLNQDMKIFVDGDMTEVGEKGVTISGGQKQRIALARAAYFNADVTIIDDALSAMDSHVGGEVFEKCFMGMLKDSTRIFMTNSMAYTKHSDLVIVVDEGKIAEQGTYEELMKLNGRFCKMMSHEIGSNEKKSSENSKEDEEDSKTSTMEVEEKIREKKVEVGEKKKKTVKTLMRKEQKTASRPSPFFMITMARSVNGEYMLLIAGLCFFLVPTLEWLQNYLLAKWVESDNQGEFNSKSISFFVAAIVYVLFF